VSRRRTAGDDDDDDDDDETVYVAAGWYNNEQTWRRQQVNSKFLVTEFVILTVKGKGSQWRGFGDGIAESDRFRLLRQVLP